MYTVNRDKQTGKVNSIQIGNTSIPLDPANMDYQRFLVWNSKQDIPLDLSDEVVPTLKSREELEWEFLNQGSEEERIPLWICLVRNIIMKRELSRKQFDENPIAYISDPTKNDEWADKIIDYVLENPQDSMEILKANGFDFNPWRE